MRVLIACEYSGTVRDEFSSRGHYAMSCDFQEGETAGNHYRGDVFDVIDEGWDLMIAHPPCERVCVSGARWKYEKPGWTEEQEEAINFIRSLMNVDVPRICIENPVGIVSTRIREPTQIIQPWQFGHGEVKATCLWLKRLPKLKPTKIVDGRVTRSWLEAPGPDRKKRRAWKYSGIASAMAVQWNESSLAEYDKNHPLLFDFVEFDRADT